MCVRSFRTLCGDDTPMVRRAAAGKLGVSLVCVFVRVQCRVGFLLGGGWGGGGFSTSASCPKNICTVLCKILPLRLQSQRT